MSWGNWTSDDDSSSSESSCMSADSFAETDEKIRHNYRATLSSDFELLRQFAHDHMDRASNTAASGAVCGAVKQSVDRAAAAASEEAESEKRQPRWKTLMNSVIRVLSSVSAFSEQQQGGKSKALSVEELSLLVKVFGRTLTLLCLLNRNFDAFKSENGGGSEPSWKYYYSYTADDAADGDGAKAATGEEPPSNAEDKNQPRSGGDAMMMNSGGDQRKSNDQKKKKRKNNNNAEAPSKFWFDITLKKRRKKFKAAQLQGLVHAARMLVLRPTLNGEAVQAIRQVYWSRGHSVVSRNNAADDGEEDDVGAPAPPPPATSASSASSAAPPNGGNDDEDVVFEDASDEQFRDADHPFCPEMLREAVFAVAQEEPTQDLVRRAIHLTAKFEVMVASEQFWYPSSSSSSSSSHLSADGDAATTMSPTSASPGLASPLGGSPPSPQQRQPVRRSRTAVSTNRVGEDNNNNDNNNDAPTNTNHHTAVANYVDHAGNEWTPQLRAGCSLIGGVTQSIRGLLEQLRFDISRAKDEFLVPPQPLWPLPNEKGWMSRFEPSEKFSGGGDDAGGSSDKNNGNNASPTCWCHISRELKKYGIKERLIARVSGESSNVSDQATAAQQHKKKKVESPSSALPLVEKHEEEKDEPKAGSGDRGGPDDGDNDAQNDANSSNRAHGGGGGGCDGEEADGDEEEEAERLRQNAERDRLRVEKKQKGAFHPEKVPSMTSVPLSVEVPCQLSRIVRDRALARHEVHSSYEKIRDLMGELRVQLAHFSECSQAAHVLENVAPSFLGEAERDLVALRQVSELLLAGSAIACAAPSFFFGLPSRTWVYKMRRLFLVT